MTPDWSLHDATPDRSARRSRRALQGGLLALALLVAVGGFAPAATADAAPALQDASDDVDVEVDVSSTNAFLWQGQTVRFTGFEGGETVEFRHDDGYVQRVASGGEVTVDTADMAVAEWTVEGQSSGASATFDVVDQALEAELGSKTLAPDGTTTLALDSARVEYTVALRSDAASASELAAAIEGASLEDDTAVLDVSGNGVEAEVDASELPAGTHTLEVDVRDTTASGTLDLLVQSVQPEPPTFDFTTRSEHVGDVAEIGFGGDTPSEEFWFAVRDEHGYYEAVVHVEAVDHDEELVVDWNLHHAADESANLGFGSDTADVTVSEVDGEAIDTLDHLTEIDGGWEFELESYGTRDAVDDGDFEDVALVSVDRGATGDLHTSTAPGPGAHDHDDDLDAILDDATETDAIARDDLLVAEVEASGVYGYLNATPAGFQREGLDLAIHDTGEFGETRVADVADLDGDASVVARPDDDVLYLVADAGALDELENGEQYELRFSVDGDENPYVPEGETETAAATFAVEERDVAFTGEFTGSGRLVLPASEDAEVAAETNVAPGTEARVRVNLPRDFRTATAEVQPDGTVSTAIDISDADPETLLNSVRLRVPNSETQATTEGIVGDGSDSFRAVDTSVSAPIDLYAGENGSIDVTVSNEGTVDATDSLYLAVDGTTVVDESLELPVGENVTRSVEVGAEEAGEIEYVVETDEYSRNTSITVVETFDLGDNDPRPFVGSDLYYDFDGDGWVTQSDVVAFFEHHFYESVQNHPEYFDYTGNGDVGHGDVIELFEGVATGEFSDDPFA